MIDGLILIHALKFTISINNNSYDTIYEEYTDGIKWQLKLTNYICIIYDYYIPSI